MLHAYKSLHYPSKVKNHLNWMLQVADNWVKFEWGWMSETDFWTLKQKRAACNQYVLVVNSDKPWTKQQQHVTSLPINKGAYDRSTNLEADHVLCVCITGYLDEEKQEIRVTKRRGGAKKKGSQKAEVVWERKQEVQGEKVKILAGRKTLEMGEDTGDEGGGWRQMLGDAQGPWPKMSKTGNHEQLHNTNWCDFLPDPPRPAATSLLGSEVETWWM